MASSNSSTSISAAGLDAGTYPAAQFLGDRDALRVRPLLAPRLQRGDDRAERMTQRREAVLDPRRNLGEDLAMDEPVVLELTKLPGERPVSDVAEFVAKPVHSGRAASGATSKPRCSASLTGCSGTPGLLRSHCR